MRRIFIFLMCFKYFYNNGYLSYKDYKDIFVDGRNDGGIDLITVNEDNLVTSLVFIQSKCIHNINNKQEIVDILTKMDQTIKNFQRNKTSSYNDKIKRILKDKLDYVEDLNPTYNLVLFICCDVTDNFRNEVDNTINNIDNLELYKISIYYQSDITNQIEYIREPRKSVPEGKISYIKSDGIIKYGDNGLLVNISSNSLKDLFDRYKDQGLFEQNFRYYFTQKRIDDNINLSLKNRREDFWFLNNGIIIGCSSFEVDGNKIKLWDFSIINGCQTTTLIGKYKGNNQNSDFAIPCKIIMPKSEEDAEEFIAEIAEASNSQKPISDRDLKSNSSEQRTLKKMLVQEDPPVFLEIKKGEQKISKKGKYDWQFVKNDVIGQVILSFNLQQPGTARSNKSKIFSDNNIYYRVFRRKHDKNTIVDLLKLDFYYSNFAEEMTKKNTLDPEQESVILNGKLFVLAIIGFMIKVKRCIIDLAYIKDEESWELELSKDNLDGCIFSNYDGSDFLDILEGLFSHVAYNLTCIYNSRSKEDKTVSNFFKTDSKYRNVIIKNFIQRIYNNKIELNDLNNKYMKIFN